MSSKERSFQRKVAKDSEETMVPENHLRLPVGTVMSDPVKGRMLAVPLFGWTAKRVKVQVPLVMLVVLLIDAEETVLSRGYFQIELPVYPETELATLHYLEALGWDGRVWPEEPGWPEGDEAEESSLRALMDQANLNNTLVFPPRDEGAPAVEILVERAEGPFLMPPLAQCSEEEVKHLVRFRELCSKPWK